MQAIRLDSPEAIKQYKRDCKADRDRAKAEEPKPILFESVHDTSLVGAAVYVPPEIIGMYLNRQELELLRIR